MPARFALKILLDTEGQIVVAMVMDTEGQIVVAMVMNSTGTPKAVFLSQQVQVVLLENRRNLQLS